MANEVVIIVKSENRTKPGMDGAGRDVDRLKVKTKELGAEFDRTSQRTDEFGRRLHGTGTFTDFLGVKIGKLREETHRLADEFNRTGDSSLLDKIFSARNVTRDLEKIKTQISTALTEGGQEGSRGVFAALQGVLGTPVLGPIVLGALIAGALAAAPVLSGIIGGAITGTVGLGAVFSGAFTELKTDPQVKAAGRDFLAFLGDEWKADSRAFAAPVEDALMLLKADLAGPLQGIGRDFAEVAPYTRDFAMYLGAAAQALEKGLGEAVRRSGPEIKEFGHDIAIVAGGVGDFLAQVSRGGRGETEALRSLALTIADILRLTGQWIHGLSIEYDWLVRSESAVIDWADKWLGSWTLAGVVIEKTGIKDKLHEIINAFDDSGSSISGMAQSIHGAAALSADDMAQLAAKIGEVAQTTDRLQGQIADKLLDTLLGSAHAALGFEESLTRASKAIQENGRTLDIHTEKGQANQEAIYAMVEANKRLFDQNMATGMSMRDATTKWDENTQRIYAWGRSVGLSKAQIDGLIGSMKSVPDKVQANVAMYGLTAAIDNLSEMLSLIYHIQNNRIIDVEVRARINAPGNFGHLAAGGIAGAASGTVRSGLTWVGEQGRELLELPAGTRVHSNPDSERMAAEAAAAGGSRGGAAGRTVFVGPGVDTAFGSYLQRMIAAGEVSIN